MNTKQLEYFLELSQTLNYRQASERLGVTQPTLTKAMQHLERELGFALFSKQGRSIRLTGQAQALIPYARECLDCLEQGVRAAEQERPVLRLGCIAAIENTLLPSFVTLYRKQNPGSYVQIHNNVSIELQDMLEADQLDLVLCTPSQRYSDLVFFDLFQQPLVICLPPRHPLARRRELLPEDIVHETFISHTRGGLFYQLYSSIFDDLHCQLDIAAEADEDNALLSLVRSGMGICIVAMSPTLKTDGVAVVPFRQDKVQRVVGLGCKRSRVRELDVAVLVKKLKSRNRSG